MSQKLRLPYVSHCDTVVSRSDKGPFDRPRDPSFRVTISYFNCLAYAVNVTDRNNVIITIPPLPYSSASAELIIEYRINLPNNVKINWDTSLHEEKTTAMVEALRSLTHESTISPNKLSREYIIEYRVKHSSIQNREFSLYLEDLDIVVSRNDQPYSVVHPYSLVGQSLVLSENKNVDGFQYRVIINDPYDEFGDRFINVNGNVFRVKQAKDMSLRPGVYVYAHDICDTDTDYRLKVANNYYSFKDADDNEQIRLFATAHLAASLGDAFYVREQEIKEMEVENKKKITELNMNKIQMETVLKDLEFNHKQELMKMERENARLKDDLERQKNRREEKTAESKFQYEQKSRVDKDYYENRSYNRKDSSEVMKWLPGIIGTIATIVNIVIAVARG